MPKKRHTEVEIISALKRYKGGEKTTNICRKLEVCVEEAVRRSRCTGAKRTAVIPTHNSVHKLVGLQRLFWLYTFPTVL